MKIKEVKTINIEFELKELRMLEHLVQIALREKHDKDSSAFYFGKEFRDQISELV